MIKSIQFFAFLSISIICFSTLSSPVKASGSSFSLIPSSLCTGGGGCKNGMIYAASYVGCTPSSKNIITIQKNNIEVAVMTNFAGTVWDFVIADTYGANDRLTITTTDPACNSGLPFSNTFTVATTLSATTTTPTLTTSAVTPSSATLTLGSSAGTVSTGIVYQLLAASTGNYFFGQFKTQVSVPATGTTTTYPASFSSGQPAQFIHVNILSDRTLAVAPVASFNALTAALQISVVGPVASSSPSTVSVKLTGVMSNPAPSGVVTISENGAPLPGCIFSIAATIGSVTAASCQSPLALGAHSLSANYFGDSVYGSGVVAQSASVAITPAAGTPNILCDGNPKKSCYFYLPFANSCSKFQSVKQAACTPMYGLCRCCTC